MSTTNGGPAEAPASNPTPQLMVLAQYVKDLSFRESRMRRASLQQNVPAADQHLGQRHRQPMSGMRVEVQLRLEGKAEAAGSVMFNIELVFAGVFRAQNVPQDKCNRSC